MAFNKKAWQGGRFQQILTGKVSEEELQQREDVKQISTMQSQISAMAGTIDSLRNSLDTETAARKMGDTIALDSLGIKDGKVIKATIVEIGDWDMDAAGVVNIPHGLSLLTYRKIRSINVLIRDDGDSFRRDIFHCQAFNDGTVDGAYIASITNTIVQIVRIEGGTFDGVTYDATSYNRGWLTIWYEG